MSSGTDKMGSHPWTLRLDMAARGAGGRRFATGGEWTLVPGTGSKRIRGRGRMSFERDHHLVSTGGVSANIDAATPDALSPTFSHQVYNMDQVRRLLR